jgi:hypothetical protein
LPVFRRHIHRTLVPIYPILYGHPKEISQCHGECQKI